MNEFFKRMALSMVIAFGLMFIWQKLFPPPPRVVEKQEVPAEIAAVESSTAAEEAAVELGEEEFKTFDFEKVAITFSTYGGKIVSYKLKEAKFENREVNQPEELVRGEKNPGLFELDYPDSSFNLPEKTEWKIDEVKDKEIRFTWENENLKIIKFYKLIPENYSIELWVDTSIKTKRGRQTLELKLSSFEKISDGSGGGILSPRVDRTWKGACLVDKDLKERSSKELIDEGPLNHGGKIAWGGFLHPYFLLAMAPKSNDGRRIGCKVIQQNNNDGSMVASLIFPEVSLEPNVPATEKVLLYLGPKYTDSLARVDEMGDHSKLVKAVDFGWFGMIAGPLLALLKWIYSFVGNWGVAIIILTFIVKAVTLPWVHKSMKSMQAMAKLRPEMDKIKEKYKDDPKRQQMETMNLMKTHNVSFLSGCLPMVLQMPIWFAFYRTLMVATELYQADFLWLKDLTLPDPYFALPIAVTLVMFIQTRLSPQTGTGMQQKMMTIGMPIMFGVFSFFFPSGLALYMFVNTSLTAVHHLFMHKDKRAEARKAKLDALTEKANKEQKISETISLENKKNEPKNKKGKRKNKKK